MLAFPFVVVKVYSMINSSVTKVGLFCQRILVLIWLLGWRIQYCLLSVA